jgi:hypothetical protein
VVSERSGRWLRAVEVPGTAALNKAEMPRSTLCRACGRGSCLAGGFFTDGRGHHQSFVVRERNGRWLQALEVPGTAVLNVGGNAVINSVSCSSSQTPALTSHSADP